MTEQMLNGTTHSIAFITGRSKILITHHSETLQLRRGCAKPPISSTHFSYLIFVSRR